TDVDGAPTSALPFAIDRPQDGITLREITSAAIESLTTENEKGFFLMVEGGKIDHSSHGNDAMTTLQQVLAFNEAVLEAYAFYLIPPDESLIVVTAEHVTGGMIISNGSYVTNTANLQHQKVSQSFLPAMISDLPDRNPETTWADV